MNSQSIINSCDDPYDINQLKREIRDAEFLANARNKFNN